MSALFRRRDKRHSDEEDPVEGVGDTGVEGVDDTGAEDAEAEEFDDVVEEVEEEQPRLSPRPEGPWDASERSDGEGLIDLGALRLPGVDGMQLRLEIEEPAKVVTSVIVQLEGSALQLQAFAAPRSEGIWSQISTEIAAGITRQGGTVEDGDGPYGRELLARIPVRTAEGRSGHQRTRFIGIDGPRWFLRAVLHGPAAQKPEAAAPLEAILRDVIVVRGGEAMAPRDLLTLHLPPEAGTAAEEEEQEQAPARPPLDPYRRGPEITEIR